MFETATRTWKIKTGDEARGDGLTFYTRHGDVFVIACTVMSILLLAAAAQRVRSARKSTGKETELNRLETV